VGAARVRIAGGLVEQTIDGRAIIVSGKRHGQPLRDAESIDMQRPTAEVFRVFLKLGLTSFGGPIAHLGYFHREFVEKRRWLDASHYGQLVALCQFLPGPASSQLGFSLGLLRAGWSGAMAAFIAFTLPSALLLLAFAQLLPYLEQPYGQAAIHGLKLVAVAVVAQGVLAMARRLTPDMSRALIAAGAALLMLVGGPVALPLVVVATGAVLGLGVCRGVAVAPGPTLTVGYGARTGAVLLVGCGILLLAALAVGTHAPPLTLVAAGFYRAGALVFGGGHVVLPLLQQTVVDPGWVPADEFLAGYGAAQAVPGPMFSLAAYLGARLHGAPGGAIGATVSLIAIFLPGLLLVAGALPFWHALSGRAGVLRALAGVNAAVVGLLAAALYDPVWTGAVHAPADVAIALLGFVLLAATRVSVVIVLVASVLACLLRAGG
jgi:chromate transporter